ncbi:MAG: riboflavin synthase [Desulfobacteraceae bacterium]|nr:riboflavin synthase [Desulfobacteraceae bacterium]
MFTGIIEGLGTVAGIQPAHQGTQLSITSDFALDGTTLGDSIAVCGACLTAVKLEGRRFSVDVSPETLGKTILDRIKTGDRVNLERALRLSDRLDGHLVSGHVDGIGTLVERAHQANAVIIRFQVTEDVSRYFIKKGSVAVDGVSLTINDCDSNGFTVSIIPHTAKLTTIGFKKVGESVNIETDMIGKYVERFLQKPGGDTGKTHPGDASIDLAFLNRTGFL